MRGGRDSSVFVVVKKREEKRALRWCERELERQPKLNLSQHTQASRGRDSYISLLATPNVSISSDDHQASDGLAIIVRYNIILLQVRGRQYKQTPISSVVVLAPCVLTIDFT